MIPAAGRGITSGLQPLPEQEAEMRGLRKVNHFEKRSSAYSPAFRVPGDAMLGDAPEGVVALAP